MDEQTLTKQPAWVQEALKRANKATKEPWEAKPSGYECDWRLPSRHCVRGFDSSLFGCGGCEYHKKLHDGVTLEGPEIEAEDYVAYFSDEDGTFIAHARTDVPRLIEAAAGMAEALQDAQAKLEELRDAATGGAFPQGVMARVLAGVAAYDISVALAKYRGEKG